MTANRVVRVLLLSAATLGACQPTKTVLTSEACVRDLPFMDFLRAAAPASTSGAAWGFSNTVSHSRTAEGVVFAQTSQPTISILPADGTSVRETFCDHLQTELNDRCTVLAAGTEGAASPPDRPTAAGAYAACSFVVIANGADSIANIRALFLGDDDGSTRLLVVANAW